MTERRVGPFVGPALRRSVAELLSGRDELGAECQKLLEVVRKRCPGILPPPPLPAGTVGPEIPLNPDEVQRLVTVAATTTSGATPGAPVDTVVWTHGGSELLVVVAKVGIHLDKGIVVVTIPVQCDQVPEAVVEVGFAVGDVARPAGMLAVTEDRPRGPAAVVDLWGDALTAFAWQLVLSVSSGVARSAGEDADGAALVPAAVTATPDGLRVLTMARHTFDRVTP